MLSSKTYWENPLESEFEVKITSCQKQNESFHLSIDRDVIRPEGGGQAGERGVLVTKDGSVKVTNTIKMESETVLITSKPIDVGMEAVLRIDMNWRRDMMKNHTAEHLFVSQMKQKNPGVELGYIWIDGKAGTVEILGESVNIDQILEAEKLVQTRINENHKVNSFLLNPDEVSPDVRAREGVYKKHDKIRVVKIGDLDESACSGIHASTTGEIGLFKINDIQVHEASTRIHFVTSQNAIDLVTAVFNDALKRKDEVPFEMEQLGMVLDKTRRTSQSRDELISIIIELLRNDVSATLIGDISFRHHYLPGFEAKELRVLLKSIPSEKKSATLLFAPGQKSNVVFWTNGLTNPASYYISAAIEELGGKGGGSKESFTGGFTNGSNPRAIYEKLVEVAKKNLEHSS